MRGVREGLIKFTTLVINQYHKYLMKEEFLKSRYIHCDETRIQVIDEPDHKGSTQNWMWVYLTDEFSESPWILEELIKNKTADEKYEERQKQSKPVLDALFEWLHTIYW